jgi:hypothetical protein
MILMDTIFEQASRPLVATTNSEVVASSYSDDGQLEDCYGIVQDITESRLEGGGVNRQNLKIKLYPPTRSLD